mgnify:CR=1 FL=1
MRNIRDSDLEGLARFLEGTPHVDAKGFDAYADHLKSVPVVKAWQWIPAVTEAELAPFERDMRSQGLADFTVWQRGLRGGPSPAAGRPVLYPVALVAPRVRGAVEPNRSP